MNDNPNKTRSESQSAQILAYLQDGNKLTALNALKLFGCLRLGSRIFDLRERGYNITREMVTLADGKRVAEYSYKG